MSFLLLNGHNRSSHASEWYRVTLIYRLRVWQNNFLATFIWNESKFNFFSFIFLKTHEQSFQKTSYRLKISSATELFHSLATFMCDVNDSSSGPLWFSIAKGWEKLEVECGKERKISKVIVKNVNNLLHTELFVRINIYDFFFFSVIIGCTGGKL